MVLPKIIDGSVEPPRKRRKWAGTPERGKSILKTPCVKANRRGVTPECHVRRGFRGHTHHSLCSNDGIIGPARCVRTGVRKARTNRVLLDVIRVLLLI